MVKDIRISNFDYELPDSLIPRYPMARRDECRLLVCSPQGYVFHKKFKELPGLLPPGALLICNDTKVIKARLGFRKESGAAIEIFLLEPLQPADYALNFQSTDKCRWKTLVGNLKKWKEGDLSLDIPLENGLMVSLFARRLHDLPEGGVAVEFHWNNPEISFSRLIENAGKIPIPPYLHRESEESDINDYQTVFACNQGSVAAPTAGLHFTPEVFYDIEAHAIEVKKLTLHVGAGTFRPVKCDTIGEHDMHAEHFSVTLDLLESLYKWKKEKRPVVAVGTTSVRTLESIPYIAYALMKGLLITST